MSQHFQVNVERVGPFRNETMMGRHFRVFPAVLVREKVLHNNIGRSFLPGEEIADSVDAWNGIPVVLRHPRKRGQPVSARSPEVLNARGLGFLFRSKWDEERRALLADVFVDLSRVEVIGDEAEEVVNRVEKGEAGEISTGFATHVEESSGIFAGQEYDVVLHNVVPDHLALLVEEIGACSVEDGCGLGVNEDESHEEESAVEKTDTPEGTAPEERVEDAAGGCGCGDDPEPAEQETGEEEETVAEESAPEAENAESLIARMRAWFSRMLGAENQSDEDRRQLLWQALEEKFGGPDVGIWIMAVFSDEGMVVFEREAFQDVSLLRIPFSISEDGAVTFDGDPEEVRRETQFVPVANAEGVSTESTNEEADVDRDEKIAQLQERSPLTAETLGNMSDEELTALHDRFVTENDGETDGSEEPAGTPEPEAQNEEETEEPTAENAVLAELRQEIKDLKEGRKADQAKIAHLESVTAPAAEEQTRERESLIKGLAANDRVPFEESELKDKNITELRKLDRMARPSSYVGRGAPRTPATQSEEEPAFAAPVPYWEQSQNGKEES